MSPWNRTAKSPKSITHSSLPIAGVSTLSHPPGYLESNRASYRDGDSAGHSPRYPVRSTESMLDDYLASCRAGDLLENPASSRADCLRSNSGDPSADCTDNRPERNPVSSLPSNWADNSDSYSVDSLPDCPASHPESLDSTRRQSLRYLSLMTLRTVCA